MMIIYINFSHQIQRQVHSCENLSGNIIIFSQAYRKGYRYPQYLFFLIPWYVDGWWRFEPDSYGCSVEERETTLEYSMTIMNLPFASFINSSTVTETGQDIVSWKFVKKCCNTVICDVNYHLTTLC